jgi:hypothetical protein
MRVEKRMKYMGKEAKASGRKYDAKIVQIRR